jgi:hypothetical protein
MAGKVRILTKRECDRINRGLPKIGWVTPGTANGLMFGVLIPSSKRGIQKNSVGGFSGKRKTNDLIVA